MMLTLVAPGRPQHRSAMGHAPAVRPFADLALIEPWSNRQTEGQNTKPKLAKRQMGVAHRILVVTAQTPT
jgi:hypothetical protein